MQDRSLPAALAQPCQRFGAESNKTPQKADAIIDALACPDLNQRLDMLRKGDVRGRKTACRRTWRSSRRARGRARAAAPAGGPPPARGLAAPAAHGPAGALPDCAVCRRQAAARLGGHERCGAHRPGHAGRPHAVGLGARAADARIRHLLVDEFQDTNPLQWQALHAWLAGYAGSGGGSAAPSVFIVGDPKQSIYRFRRAEPQVFIAAQAFVRDGLGGDLLELRPHAPQRAGRDCRRQRRHGAGPGAARDHRLPRPHHRIETPGQLLRLPAITDADDDGQGASRDPLAWRDSLTEPRHEAEETQRMRECAQAAAWVAAQIASGTPPKEVLVLARKRDRLASMQDALRVLHLPCVQPEKSDLFDAPEAGDMVALLDAFGLAHARPVAGPCAQVAAVRSGRRCAGGPGRCAASPSMRAAAGLICY